MTGLSNANGILSGADILGAISTRVLNGECERCVGLCCVAPAFSASADFAVDKPAGQACPNLLPDLRCGIHAELRERGFAGCVVFDCFGAGQRVSQETFADSDAGFETGFEADSDWRTNPAIAPELFAAFSVVRSLHELLWYLTAALGLPAAAPITPDLQAACVETDRLAGGDAAALAALDLAAWRRKANVLLVEVGRLARAASPGPKLDRRGASLIGADLRAVDLRGALLRGACLVGADLRGVDLALADLTGTDLRGSDLAGADIFDALFVTQSQVESARGDRATRLLAHLRRPAHWR